MACNFLHIIQQHLSVIRFKLATRFQACLAVASKRLR
jgi:hypothetical protein